MYIDIIVRWIYELLTGLPWAEFFAGLLMTWYVGIFFRKCVWKDLVEGLFVVGLLWLHIVLFF